MINKDYLKQKALTAGIELSEEALEKFSIYSSFLVEYNEKVNLTAITDSEGIAVKHFIDSLLLGEKFKIKEGASMADVGTGAGFPSVPLKIVRDDIRLTLIDSLNKRITFLGELSEKLGQDNQLVHARAEQAGIDSKLREKFDVVTARAVAELRVLAEYCLPFVKVGGYFVSLKGPSGAEELENAKNAIELLGGGEVSVINYSLLDNSERSLVVIKKHRNTPTKYPRQRVKLSEKPL